MPIETALLERKASRIPNRTLRAKIVELMVLINELCPVSEDREEALRHLDAVAFFAVDSLRHD